MVNCNLHCIEYRQKDLPWVISHGQLFMEHVMRNCTMMHTVSSVPSNDLCTVYVYPLQHALQLISIISQSTKLERELFSAHN